MLLDKITHYYLKDKKPFQTLSDLENNTSHTIFQDMLNRHKSDKNYNRRFGINHLDTRKSVENKLRELFIKRGGKPTRQYPIYFVLGESKWFQHLNTDHQYIQIPISELPKDKVSITFPDSYLTMSAKEKPYFEKIYFLDEIDEMTTRHGLPKDHIPKSYEKYWEGDFEHYYEVQVWDDEILTLYEK